MLQGRAQRGRRHGLRAKPPPVDSFERVGRRSMVGEMPFEQSNRK